LTDEIKVDKNPKQRIPQAIRAASAQEIEKLFKRKENKMFTFNDDSNLASIAQSIASHKLPDIDAPRTVEQISSLQTLLQTHHLSMDKDEEMSALSDSSNLSFDSKTSKNRYEIERRADQMATKKLDESMHQLKLKQGLTLLQAGVLTRELATQLELPYDDIVSSQHPMEQAMSDHQSDRINTPDPLTTDLPDSDQMESSSSDHEDLDNMSDDSEESEIGDDESDSISEDTPLRGSPNKSKAAGGHNTGNKS
jgi:hypothetical protein